MIMKMGINVKKLVKAFALMSLVFSFSAIAQTTTDKPMEAKALAALVEELKGVVTRTSPDKNEAKLVGEKWDARKDLNGKTKSEVIELLYVDVKSVIKDSGTQYQIYSMFSFYKTIPDDSPTDKSKEAKALAALVEELKGVVSRTAPDKNEAKLVGEKWDARKDLTGKTKSEVIELLFEDVKSVIKDSGTQYQIYSIFSFQKQIPDEFLTSQTKETLSKFSEAELLNKLVELTFQVRIEKATETPQMSMSPEEVEETKRLLKESEANEKKDRIKEYDEILEQNKKLTTAQKSFVRANYDQLIKTIDNLIDESNNKYSPIETWVKDGLQKNYKGKFNKEELIDLILKFQEAKGDNLLESVSSSDFIWDYLMESYIEELEKNATGDQKEELKKFYESPRYKQMVAERTAYLEFASTKLGKKFINAYIDETDAYIESKQIEALKKYPQESGYYTKPENINKIFNKFVEENYKK